MGKRVCFNCGASNEEGTKFCNKCGSDLTIDNYNINQNDYVEVTEESKNQLEVITKINTKYCSKCGAILEEDDKFCSTCGESVDGSVRDDLVHCPKCGSTQINFVRYEEKNNYDVTTGVCGLVLCGPLGLLFGLRDKSPEKTVRKCQKCNHEF